MGVTPFFDGPTKEVRDGPEIRQVFSDNLKELIGPDRSVASVARELEINRTQFNRYLSGAAFPRPDILERIIQHFGVDARIMTMPLSDLMAEARAIMPLSHASKYFAHLGTGFDHSRMPDGLYAVTMPRLVDSAQIMTLLFRLYTLAPGTAAIDWALPDYYAALVGFPMDWRKRRATGLVVPHVDGVSFYLAHPSTRTVRTMFFGFGYQGANDLHAGYVASTMRLSDGSMAAYPALLERIPRDMAAHVAARRRCRAMSFKDAPPAFQHHYRNAMR